MRSALPALLLLPFAAVAASGDASCAACHKSEASHFPGTPMGLAALSVGRCDILQKHPLLEYREGPFHTEIKTEGNRSTITVTRGTETFSTPILYALGQGKAGQTYVFQYDGAIYESRASYYNAIGGLDITIGDIGTVPQTVVEAAGRRLAPLDAANCFGCHTNGAVVHGMLHLDAVTPGVGCQSCHGDVERHEAAVRSGNVAAARLPHLGDLAAEDMLELCGQCHRTWAQIAQTGMNGPNTVRFQPYRLTNSKCYDVDDKRIRCTACHDPHGQIDTNLASYDSKCTACHAAALHTKTCPVSKENCVTCHMPKIDLPGAHHQFTDHEIRIVRAGGPYPN
ncbi:MAG TPA: multiheme c-type cytochrome [Bryobacteraceae bacterium]|nr:multiheme c-type cytochrome [Bryobacteraceae bacterium]